MARKWWQRGRRPFRTTREGKWFITFTFLVGFGAINTGNNLLYLLLGWMFSLLVANGILSERALRGLSVSRLPPPRVHAGRPFLMAISLENLKRRLPSFSIEIEDLIGGRPLDKKCYFLKVPAGRTQSTRYRHTFTRRGLYRFDGFRISTKYPFALLRKSREVDAPGELIVYPAVVPVTPPHVPVRAHGETPHARLGRHGEFFGLREYRAGDDVRDVHWAKSAAHPGGRLLVREFEEEAQRRATVLVDNGLRAGASEQEEEALERAVSLAASLCNHYIARGYAVRLFARGQEVPASAGPAQLLRLLKALALLPTVAPEVPFSGRLDAGAENLLVAQRGRAPERLPAGVGRVMEAT